MSGNRGGLFGSTTGREEWKPYDEEDRERAGALQEDESRACAAGSGQRMVRYGRSGKVFQCRSAVAICSFELSGLGRESSSDFPKERQSQKGLSDRVQA